MWSGCLDGQGGPGNPGGPGSPGGPGGQGCLGGQSGPDDQVCQCIWFAWSKQSYYRENLRFHACDKQTSRILFEESLEFSQYDIFSDVDYNHNISQCS